jgi:HD superfamily phosphohydrolase
MATGRIRRVQDSVHGLMEFHGVESVVIDLLRTRELQRLTRIKQTGLAYLVFPGCEHSRFAHGLGAAFLALRFGRHLQEVSHGLLADLLVPNEFVVRDLAVAALCHDLGHGPLSHAWEREIVGPDFDRQRWLAKLGLEGEAEGLGDAKWHELVGQALLRWGDGQLHKLLEQHEAGFSERVRQLLRGNYFLDYLPRILSSDIDVDRADYMIRDAWQSGVAYGRYDLNWLVSTCTLGYTRNRELVIGFDHRKAIKVVEQFLVARSALYDTVYHHKTVRSAEGRLEAFLRRCRDVADETQFPRERFIAPVVRILRGDALAPWELLELDDSVLWAFVGDMARLEGADPVARNLANRLLSRDLLKLVPVASKRLEEHIERFGHERIKREVAKYVGGDPGYFVHLDRAEFAWFMEEPHKESFFVNDEGTASPIRHDPQIEHFPQHGGSTVRLFTVREAVEDVRRVVVGKR